MRNLLIAGLMLLAGHCWAGDPDSAMPVRGTDVVGATQTDYPVKISGVDGNGKIRNLSVDAFGRIAISTASEVPVGAGRQVVIASATAVTSVTTEALFTMTVSTAFTNGTSGTSFGVPAGKTFRIQRWGCTWRDTAAIVGTGTCRLRIQSSGPCTVSSPVVDEVAPQENTNAATLNAGQDAHSSFPDGLEISGTQTFCISHLDSSALTNEDVNIVGFQY